jgi:hypothetical protein
MDDLKKFANWWSLLAAAGTAIAAASVTQQNPAGMFFGAGLLLIGAGEWVCRHSQRTEIFRGPVPGVLLKRTSNPWKPKPLGIALDLLGFAALARAVYLVAFAP